MEIMTINAIGYEANTNTGCSPGWAFSSGGAVPSKVSCIVIDSVVDDVLAVSVARCAFGFDVGILIDIL